MLSDSTEMVVWRQVMGWKPEELRQRGRAIVGGPRASTLGDAGLPFSGHWQPHFWAER